MRYSGDTVDLSSIPGVKVDKHSTGGVGDKTTLIVAPLASACGVPIAKMSGRGLGFTGGTVDKMESVPGFRTSLEPEAFLASGAHRSAWRSSDRRRTSRRQIRSSTRYRDVTATVDNFGLIASSIMSKKLAAGSDAIVLDVKVGDGAFMENERGRRDAGGPDGRYRPTMRADEPSRRSPRWDSRWAARSAMQLEVIEAIETLKGHGPEDIAELAGAAGRHHGLPRRQGSDPGGRDTPWRQRR